MGGDCRTLQPLLGGGTKEKDWDVTKKRRRVRGKTDGGRPRKKRRSPNKGGKKNMVKPGSSIQQAKREAS